MLCRVNLTKGGSPKMDTIPPMSLASLAILTILIISFVINKIRKGIRMQSSLHKRWELITLLLKCKDWTAVSDDATKERILIDSHPRYFNHWLNEVIISPEGKSFLRGYREAIFIKNLRSLAILQKN